MRHDRTYRISWREIPGRGWRYAVGFDGSKLRWVKTFDDLDEAISWCMDHGTEFVWESIYGDTLEHWRRVND